MDSDPFEYRDCWETPAGALEIRPIAEGDEHDLLRFFRDRLSARSNLFLCMHAEQTDDEALATMRKQIAAHVSREALVYVACREGQIVGYFFLTRLHAAESKPASLGIGLADALHGLGIGGRFMDTLIAAGRRLGCRAIELTHYPDNQRAAALYQRKGFRYTGEQVSWVMRSGPRTEPRMLLEMESA